MLSMFNRVKFFIIKYIKNKIFEKKALFTLFNSLTEK
jgi:hypothetical protein